MLACLHKLREAKEALLMRIYCPAVVCAVMMPFWPPILSRAYGRLLM
jgi:hypothetical protein